MGQFEGATGLITSNFTISDTGCVQFGSSTPGSCNQSGIFQNFQMFGDCLPGNGQLMLFDQTSQDFEQRLIIALGQVFKNRPPRRVGQCLKNFRQLLVVFSQHTDIMQPVGCMSRR